MASLSQRLAVIAAALRDRLRRGGTGEAGRPTTVLPGTDGQPIQRRFRIYKDKARAPGRDYEVK